MKADCDVCKNARRGAQKKFIYKRHAHIYFKISARRQQNSCERKLLRQKFFKVIPENLPPVFVRAFKFVHDANAARSQLAHVAAGARGAAMLADVQRRSALRPAIAQEGQQLFQARRVERTVMKGFHTVKNSISHLGESLS